jgi:hypothetical protein
MLHLTDARTGRPQPVAPPGTRRLRVAYCPASLRAALAADLARRAAERSRLVVAVAAHACERPALPGLMRFNIHPPNAASAPFDVHFLGPQEPLEADAEPTPADAADAPRPGSPARILVPVPPDPRPEDTPPGDPLVLRLALLAQGVFAAGPPGFADFTAAADALALLRADVARFAESPSAAMPAARVAEVHGLIDDGLDTAHALALAHALRRDPGLPEGARFEALVHLDRFWGLDLAQDIGRTR